MSEYDVCQICGADATHYFANSPVLPLCDNYACEQALKDEINEQLVEAAKDALHYSQ